MHTKTMFQRYRFSIDLLERRQTMTNKLNQKDLKNLFPHIFILIIIRTSYKLGLCGISKIPYEYNEI
jgi:hypothetical protein